MAVFFRRIKSPSPHGLHRFRIKATSEWLRHTNVRWNTLLIHSKGKGYDALIFRQARRLAELWLVLRDYSRGTDAMSDFERGTL